MSSEADNTPTCPICTGVFQTGEAMVEFQRLNKHGGDKMFAHPDCLFFFSQLETTRKQPRPSVAVNRPPTR